MALCVLLLFRIVFGNKGTEVSETCKTFGNFFQGEKSLYTMYITFFVAFRVSDTLKNQATTKHKNAPEAQTRLGVLHL
jgi:hypothetical protein